MDNKTYQVLYGSTYSYRPQHIIVNIQGGITYDEIRAIHLLNDKLKKEKGPNVIIGSNTILRSEDFINSLINTQLS